MPSNRYTRAASDQPLDSALYQQLHSGLDFTWRTLFLEPIAGSGERMAIGIVLRGPNAHERVISTAPADTLSTLLGRAGKGIARLAGAVTEDLHGWLKHHAFDEWESPFGNVTVGPERQLVATSLEQAREIALSSTAILAALQLNGDQRSETKSRSGASAWEKSVKSAVISQRGELAKGFGCTKLLRHGKTHFKERFGFIGGRIAANFATLQARSFEYHIQAAKSDLMNLENLRSLQQESEFLPVDRYEMLVNITYPDNEKNGDEKRAQLEDAFGSLEAFGDNHSIQVIQLQSASGAAQRILQAEGGL